MVYQVQPFFCPRKILPVKFQFFHIAWRCPVEIIQQIINILQLGLQIR